MEEMEKFSSRIIEGDTMSHAILSQGDEFGYELFDIPLMEANAEWFNPVDDLNEIEALLYEKQTIKVKKNRTNK